MDYYFDELIVSEIRKDNKKALGELYKTHYPMAVHLICSNSGTEDEAKDIFQESLIAFYEKVKTPGFTLTCKIKTYLYAVCHRLWLKRLSEKKKFNRLQESETLQGIDEEMEAIEVSEKKFQVIGTALGNLGEPCRTIIEDFYVRDLSMEAIRDKHNYTSADNAKNQKYKCLQRLKKMYFTYYNQTV
jgi:RNA polymerase sigma factor (sigma-70 family)